MLGSQHLLCLVVELSQSSGSVFDGAGGCGQTRDQVVQLVEELIQAACEVAEFVFAVGRDAQRQVTIAVRQVVDRMDHPTKGAGDQGREDERQQNAYRQTGRQRQGLHPKAAVDAVMRLTDCGGDLFLNLFCELVEHVAHRPELRLAFVEAQLDGIAPADRAAFATLSLDLTGGGRPVTEQRLELVGPGARRLRLRGFEKLRRPRLRLLDVFVMHRGQLFEFVRVFVDEHHAALGDQGLIEIAIRLQQVVECLDVLIGQLVDGPAQLSNLAHRERRDRCQQYGQHGNRQNQLPTKAQIVKPRHSDTSAIPPFASPQARPFRCRSSWRRPLLENCVATWT